VVRATEHDQEKRQQTTTLPPSANDVTLQHPVLDLLGTMNGMEFS